MEFFDFLNKRLNAIAKERALITVKAKYDGKCRVLSFSEKMGIRAEDMNFSECTDIVEELKKDFAIQVGVEKQKIYVKLLGVFKDFIKEEKDV
ncbi:hypothetical protein LCGC14_1716260 [marine sediment metagenome]|uniref:Uncharacterized protein n=1 Tax=marine sediment metagenome TaxID=412755 RepID=A0A0F9I1B2_9ZZZZ